MDVERNPTMFGGNRLKLAVFGSNCSSGRAATTVAEARASSTGVGRMPPSRCVHLRTRVQDGVLDPWRGSPERGGRFLGEIRAARQHDL